MDKLFRKWTKVDKSGKKKYNQTDMTEEGKTIIAIATAAGPGAIGIIRISGPDSLKGVKRAFTGFKGEVKPNTMYYGTLTAGEYTDKCMAAYFKSPHSYTGAVSYTHLDVYKRQVQA